MEAHARRKPKKKTFIFQTTPGVFTFSLLVLHQMLTPKQALLFSMAALTQVPLSALSRACASFAAAGKIGEGATGEVFSGILDGVDVALKRLHLPDGATPEA